MIALLLIVIVGLGNFVLGFALAVHLGHGPAWGELPSTNRIRDMLRALLQLNRKRGA